MTEIKKGIKLIRPDHGKLTSYWMSGDFITPIYKIGEWTTPIGKNGPLCIFDSIKDISKNIAYICNIEVYECEYELSEEKERVWYTYTTHFGEKCNGSQYLAGLLDNTILTSKVKLTKRLGSLHEILDQVYPEGW